MVPLLSTPESGYQAGRYTYHVMPSIRDQARSLVDFAAARLGQGGGPVGLLFAEDLSGKGGGAGAREQAEKRGLTLGPEVSFTPGAFSAVDAAARLKGAGVAAVLYFGGPREALAFAEEANRLAWRPLLLAPATLAGNALQGAPEGVLPSVFLAFPFEPPDAASPGMRAFLALGEKQGVGQEHRLFQALAYAGALVLEEGIKRSGRTLNRAKLVASLSEVWAFETGVTPPLTFTANRRSGALGSAILGVDPATRRLVPAAPWQEPR
jgi:ABC-type branched-subunit amino acid transport system substrate-binding protein